jgi:hypothetical protein
MISSSSPGDGLEGSIIAALRHSAARGRAESSGIRTALCRTQPCECFPGQVAAGGPLVRACQAVWVQNDGVQPTRPAGRLDSAFVSPLGPAIRGLAACRFRRCPVRKPPLFFSSAGDASFQSPTAPGRLSIDGPNLLSLASNRFIFLAIGQTNPEPRLRHSRSGV